MAPGLKRINDAITKKRWLESRDLEAQLVHLSGATRHSADKYQEKGQGGPIGRRLRRSRFWHPRRCRRASRICSAPPLNCSACPLFCLVSGYCARHLSGDYEKRATARLYNFSCIWAQRFDFKGYLPERPRPESARLSCRHTQPKALARRDCTPELERRPSERDLKRVCECVTDGRLLGGRLPKGRQR